MEQAFQRNRDRLTSGHRWEDPAQCRVQRGDLLAQLPRHPYWRHLGNQGAEIQPHGDLSLWSDVRDWGQTRHNRSPGERWDPAFAASSHDLAWAERREGAALFISTSPSGQVIQGQVQVSTSPGPSIYSSRANKTVEWLMAEYDANKLTPLTRWVTETARWCLGRRWSWIFWATAQRSESGAGLVQSLLILPNTAGEVMPSAGQLDCSGFFFPKAHSINKWIK